MDKVNVGVSHGDDRWRAREGGEVQTSTSIDPHPDPRYGTSTWEGGSSNQWAGKTKARGRGLPSLTLTGVIFLYRVVAQVDEGILHVSPIELVAGEA